MALEMEIVSMVEGLRIGRGPKGLFVGGITSYPIYIEGKQVAFNLRMFPRNATDETFFAQLPAPPATIYFG